ncbi:BZ3500_MvSof-1268-A1-R1_Chr6-3g08955 [Microbotryum saponariae]|uniref:BZ3500_MvSof-1268-A1-R1_Chr6-3g08955 protein n=1 Tax=Microbotryum saponariae TaxID=289078 RepID=A0A2X0KPD5_9BASI|nr:BZ3500_MvSof-1268-A1-R1_Chr6-3g08955 [Microbotryum saponariae]SDA07557.1 BZ3501_MvSof-1269-A2-R1_Chr6-2g08659 [Microbotryum saponariae]
MSIQSRDLEQVMENDFVLEWSSQRTSAGYVCRYCGGERMWYRRAVRHATTKKHLDAYNSRADPAVNWANRLLQPTPQALSSSDEADLIDFNENPAETGTVGHSLLAVAGEIIKSSERVPASDPSPPSDQEDSALDHALFVPEGNCSPYSQGTGSKSDSAVEIDGEAEEEESDDWVQTWATAGSTTVVTGTPAMRTRLGVRNYTSVPDSSHPWYPFPNQNMMIIVVFFRSYKRRSLRFRVNGRMPLTEPFPGTNNSAQHFATPSLTLSCEARRRIKDALEWMKRVEKKCVVDDFYISKAKEALLNLPWHELPSNCGLADWARHDCVGIASTAQFIRAHPDSVWSVPTCDENHWFLGTIDVKHGAWSIHNSLSSRKLTVAALTYALDAQVFKVLNLNIDKAFDPTHAALSRIRQFCRAVDMIEAQEVTPPSRGNPGKAPVLPKMPKEHTQTTHDVRDPLNPSYVP